MEKIPHYYFFLGSHFPIMTMNVEKIQVMRISSQPSSLQIMIHQKQLENVEYLNCVGSMMTKDAKYTREIKYRIVMTKAAFNRQKTLFSSKLDLNIKRKLVKCYIWSIALCGVEIWTLRKVDQKYLESSEMRCWRRMEKISWTDRVRNEEVLHGVKEEIIWFPFSDVICK
jgi:hypothetical protein